MWEHGQKFDWDIHSIYAHIYRLGDTLASSKEGVEDLFGKGADLKRSNKNPFRAGSLERFHFQNSYWVRLPGDAYPKVSILKEDMAHVQNQPRRTHINLGAAAPPSTILKIMRAAILKKKRDYYAQLTKVPVSIFGDPLLRCENCWNGFVCNA